MVTPKFADTTNVLLVDGTNLLLRIFHAKTKGNLLLSSREIVESCCQIFMHQLSLHVRKYSCSRLYVLFDLGGSLRKKNILESYKQNRALQPVSDTSEAAIGQLNTTDTFIELKETIVRLCRAFNIAVIREYGIEADDIIGIAAEELTKLNKTVIILSNDSDFLQLLSNPKVICSIPYKSAEVSHQGFSEFFSTLSKSKDVHIAASEYIFYKAIVGDPSDNIDGIKGLGYKTLHKLMEATLEEESSENRALYIKDPFEYVKILASRNSSKLEKLIHDNLSLLERNYKLIDISARYASAQTFHLTLKHLMQVYSTPSRKEALTRYNELFPDSVNNPLMFVTDTLFALAPIYRKAV